MSNIRIDIASEFKDKGFKAAEKRTTSLNRKFDKLARTAKSTFIAIAGIQALKRSVAAFAEEDRAANKLEASLRNLGLAYNTQAIEDYLEQSEKATAISKDELSPAIAGLLSTTLDAEKSMRLLNLAMDISSSTGKDLTSITTALSRAYNGNFASLGKLQTAYTSAELEAMGFEESVTALNSQFAGAAKNNADTYAGKIDKMKIAFGDLAEEVGAGIIAFLESLGDGDYDKGLQKLVDFGTAIGNVFRRAGLTIEYTKALLNTGFRIDAGEQFKLDELRAQLANPQMGEFGVNRGLVRDYAKQLELQKKILREREKAAKLAEKDKKNQQELNKAKSVFDLEKIQIEAALKGKITEEERIRLQLMKAITNENATAAEDLVKKLKEVQEENAKIVKQLTTYPKANDPFVDWTKSLNNVSAQLTAIGQKKIVVDFLANYTPVSTAPITSIITPTASAQAIAALSDPAKQAEASAQVAAVEEAKADAAVAVAKAGEAIAKAAEATEAAAVAVSTAVTAEEKAAANTAIIAAVAATEAATILTESAAAAEAIAATAAVIEAETLAIASENVANILAAEAATVEATTALTDAAAMLSESFSVLASLGVMDFNFAGLDFTSLFIPDYTPPLEITVNVAGSVTTENDLAQTVYDTLLNYQKSGIDVIFEQQVI